MRANSMLTGCRLLLFRDVLQARLSQFGRILMRAWRFASFMSVGVLLAASTVCSQNYPEKPIRIVTGSAGGGTDVIARLVGRTLSSSMEQPVIIDNRAGS